MNRASQGYRKIVTYVNILRPIAGSELEPLARAAQEFRELWASINPPFPHSFDGTAADVKAIDYLHYEGIPFPRCGLHGATLLSAEVLRRAGRLKWMSNERGDWFLVNEFRVVIHPRARVEEIWLSGVPQFLRFGWFVVRAAIDCLSGAATDAESDLLCLLAELDDGWVESLAEVLCRVREATGK